jgi:D-sedoheptulose 7-phosphate isomerase
MSINSVKESAILHIQSSIEVKSKILNNQEFQKILSDVCIICCKTYQRGGKVILAGNGGSAADAQHIAAEFVSRFKFDRPALSAISLSTDTSILTAIGNDYGFENIFARQLQAHGNKGDVFIAISTSGTSKNILESLKVCKELNIISIALTGSGGGILEELADFSLCVPSQSTALIQESHIMLGHIICEAVEDTLFGDMN